MVDDLYPVMRRACGLMLHHTFQKRGACGQRLVAGAWKDNPAQWRNAVDRLRLELDPRGIGACETCNDHRLRQAKGETLSAASARRLPKLVRILAREDSIQPSTRV